MNEKVLTQYVQELSNQRTQLEYTIFQLRAEIEALKNASIQEGTGQGDSPQ